jgi:hypothetical protein
MLRASGGGIGVSKRVSELAEMLGNHEEDGEFKPANQA